MLLCTFYLVRRVGIALTGAESLKGTVPALLHPHEQHNRGTKLCQLSQNSSLTIPTRAMTQHDPQASAFRSLPSIHKYLCALTTHSLWGAAGSCPQVLHVPSGTQSWQCWTLTPDLESQRGSSGLEEMDVE